MSGFTRAWLQLREPADHRARCTFAEQLRAVAAQRWRIVDLGCGAGSNLRFLAPRIGGRQSWTCVDDDTELLETLSQRSAPAQAESIVPVRIDLAGGIEPLLEGTTGECADTRVLVTASALLDLVSAAWLDAASSACAQRGLPVLFALTYDGRIELDPKHPEDEQLRSLLNAHQGRDKGFGPALGPRAPQYARAAFERFGYAVTTAASDWQLDGSEPALQHELLEGWVGAAREQSGAPRLLHEWYRQRRKQIAAGALRVCVGHRDLFASPAATG